MDEFAVEQLAADIFFLLECTKDLSGIVPGGAVFAAEDCRKRLGEFLGTLKKKRRKGD